MRRVLCSECLCLEMWGKLTRLNQQTLHSHYRVSSQLSSTHPSEDLLTVRGISGLGNSQIFAALEVGRCAVWNRHAAGTQRSSARIIIATMSCIDNNLTRLHGSHHAGRQACTNITVACIKTDHYGRWQMAGCCVKGRTGGRISPVPVPVPCAQFDYRLATPTKASYDQPCDGGAYCRSREGN